MLNKRHAFHICGVDIMFAAVCPGFLPRLLAGERHAPEKVSQACQSRWDRQAEDAKEVGGEQGLRMTTQQDFAGSQIATCEAPCDFSFVDVPDEGIGNSIAGALLCFLARVRFVLARV